MIKGQPKGLIAASLANMGERFGFYTMMAILVLFLMSKFGLDKTSAGIIYSVFYFSIYILALIGGIIADKTRNYKGTILTGLILMAVGYLLLTIPTPTPAPEGSRMTYLIMTCFGLFVIAFGNGLFKGNLQALVGQMYDNPEFNQKRDSGFSLFYMFINVGAIFAPFIAPAVREWWLGQFNFAYNSDLPELCHGFINNTLTPDAMTRFNELAASVCLNDTNPGELMQFANSYLDVFTQGFHYAFGVAIIAMLISLAIFLVSKNNLPGAKGSAKKSDAKQEMSKEEIVMSAHEVKQRIWALMAVFAIVIFFWFSFHQNGLTLTFFAKDYTLLKIGSMNITAEQFQAMNPFFVVFLTPVVLAIFGWLRARGKEPAAPAKIAIGMGIAALAYIVMVVGSLDLPNSQDVQNMGGLPDAMRVTPYLLIVVYFILTVAELFISPLGLSFVSKVAPPQYQGLMQGGWLGATALGNQLLFIGAILYEHVPLWITWSVFVVACCISMVTMIMMLGWLNRITK